MTGNRVANLWEMKMKYQVTASEYADLNEDVQKNYGSEKDGKHTIKVDGMPDYAEQEARITAMDTKVTDLLTETKTAKKKAKDAEALAAQAVHDKANKDGDVEALEKSWQKKYDTLEETLTGERDVATGALHQATAHSDAMELSTTLAVKGSAIALMPHIEPRIYVEIVDGKAVSKVRDINGQPSALTLKELGEEIAGNPAFAPLIEASRAAGGGANGTQRGGAAQTKTLTKAAFDALTPQGKMDFSKDDGQITEI